MHAHHPSCLDGPVSGGRDWWHERLKQLETGPTFRAELVARVRREIAAGTYDTPEKLEAALDKLFLQLEWGQA